MVCGVIVEGADHATAAGATVPNAVLTPVSSTGDVCFYAHADTDLIADVNGWFPG